MLIYMCFFVKKKTAYEMRISDGCAYVGSSDLRTVRGDRAPGQRGPEPGARSATGSARNAGRHGRSGRARGLDGGGGGAAPSSRGNGPRRRAVPPHLVTPVEARSTPLASAVKHCPRPRSEEHTSELQSLMRNSYAVFCLKKK